MNKNTFFWRDSFNYIYQVLEEQIETHDLSYVLRDVRYPNDTCPSIEIETETETYMLFTPNSWRNDGEETNTFMLIYDKEYSYVENYRILHNLEQVVNLLIEKENKDLIL